MDFFQTIASKGTAELKERGSRFIAYAMPVRDVSDFKKELQLLKKEHPKAVHHCFAYRIGTDGNNFRSSDDGEPAGTAGKPILGQIDSRTITDTAVVVVRYFGGTLLGVPGLIQAYKSVTALVLQVTPVVTRPVLIPYRLEFDYTLTNQVNLLIKNHQGEVRKRENMLFCEMEIEIPRQQEESFLHHGKDLRNVVIIRKL